MEQTEKAISKSLKPSHICSGCDRTLDKLSINSPMVCDDLWNEILSYFHLSENKPGSKLTAKTPLFICSECMEKALGRKLKNEDLKPVPFNLYFQLHYFYNVPFDLTVKIQRRAIQFAKNAVKYSDLRLQSEVGFMNGIMTLFSQSDSDQFIQRLLLALPEEQLKGEVKRREYLRRAQKKSIMRCRDCIHCIQGYTSKHAASRGYKTSVCEMKPKDKAARYCFYSTLQSRKACENFEPK